MKSTPREASSSSKSKSKAKRSSLHFPVSKISQILKDGKYSERVAEGASVYLAAVLQRMAAEVIAIYDKCLFSFVSIYYFYNHFWNLPQSLLISFLIQVLELSGKAINEGKSRIGPRHIELAIRNDAGLSELLSDVTIPGSGKKIQFHEDLLPKSTGERNRDIGSGSK